MKHEHVSYGNFLGGDPREFSPDPECSTEAERAAHADACRRWNEAGGNLPPEPDYHGPPDPAAHVNVIVRKSDGTETGYSTTQRYGLGTQTWECDDPDCPEAA